MVAGLAVTVGMLPSETQATEARHTSRLQLVGNEVVIFQGKSKDKDANGGRDLFIVKTRLWFVYRFLMVVWTRTTTGALKSLRFLEMKDNFRELLEWTEKLTKMLEQEDFDACEFDQKKKPERFINERPTLQLSLPQSQR